MNFQNPDTLEKIRQQYERLPYPHRPLDAHPKDTDPTLDQFFLHSFATPYYLRNQRILDLTDRVILDAGCGSGYKALRLAHANPGAKIVGVDLSPESVRLAEQRLHYHGHEDAECHALLLEDLPSLGMTFDYINCDEVLYLVADPAAGLQAMLSVLKPDGIIRTNLHSAYQRHVFYRAQALFKMMGLMDGNPGDMEIEIVRETMRALKTGVDIRKNTWYETPEKPEPANDILVNYLLQGDRGFTVPEMFEMLRASDGEFISMTLWRYWEVIDLFANPDEIPSIWAMALPDLTDEERLHVYELMNPVHRLIDFWCGHVGQAQSFKPVVEWEYDDWQHATVHLNPLLQSQAVREDAVTSVKTRKSFSFSQYISFPSVTQVTVESHDLAVLLPLWDGPQPFEALVKRYLQIYPVDPVSFTPNDELSVFDYVCQVVSKLELFLYLMVEQRN